jgi:thiamine-monophosphate kinase
VGEEAAIARIAAHIGRRSRLGDDGAWLTEPLPRGLVATVDSQIEDVHFRRSALSPGRLARRLVAVNASDLAASASVPRFGLLALAAPADFPVEAFSCAVVDALGEVGAELVGGDLARSDKVVATLTLLGEPVRSGPLLGRNQARSGDRLWIRGTPGLAALGCELMRRGGRWLEGRDPELPTGVPATLEELARSCLRTFFEPTPQLALGRELGGLARVAAIDCSDGLAKDLHRLAAASGVGIVVDEASIELPAPARELAHQLGLDPLEAVVGGGEDYLLLVATDQDLVGLGMRACGAVEAETGVRLRRANGAVATLPAAGWDHLGG